MTDFDIPTRNRHHRKKQIALYVEPHIYGKLKARLDAVSHAQIAVIVLQDVLGPTFTREFKDAWPSVYRKPQKISPRARSVSTRCGMVALTVWLPSPLVDKAILLARHRSSTLQAIMRNRAYALADSNATPPPLKKRGPKPRRPDPRGTVSAAA